MVDVGALRPFDWDGPVLSEPRRFVVRPSAAGGFEACAAALTRLLARAMVSTRATSGPGSPPTRWPTARHPRRRSSRSSTRPMSPTPCGRRSRRRCPARPACSSASAATPAVLELFEHPDSFAAQWDAIVDGLLRSTLHVPTVPTPGRRARKFVRRLSSRPTTTVADAGKGLLTEVADDLVSVRSLCTRDGHLVHTAALNVRHDLVLAA